MRKIRIIKDTNFIAHGVLVHSGSTISVEDEDASEWVKKGIAEWVDEPEGLQGSKIPHMTEERMAELFDIVDRLKATTPELPEKITDKEMELFGQERLIATRFNQLIDYLKANKPPC